MRLQIRMCDAHGSVLMLDQFDGVWLVEPGCGHVWWAVARTNGGMFAVYRRDEHGIALTFHRRLDDSPLPADVAGRARDAAQHDGC